jgi:glucose/arabinose dehydrogenase
VVRESVHCWQGPRPERTVSIARARQHDAVEPYRPGADGTGQCGLSHLVDATMHASHALTLLAVTAALAACGDTATLPLAAGTGPRPELPAPHKDLIPTVHVAPATGWVAGDKPIAAAGLTVSAYATRLDHPRWLSVLPNGDVLVAETNAPPKPEDGKGFKGWVMKQMMKRAGAGTPSADRITLLRGLNSDGSAAARTVFVEHLHSPFGMTLVGSDFYVANSDGIVRFPYVVGATRIDAAPVSVAALPAGPINHHWTKNVIASTDGAKLYATVGSNSNAAENGIAAEEGRAAIWEIDRQTGQGRVFASGLRNPNGMAWASDGTLWTVANERDELGSDLVPDYLTSVRDGAFYGWPYSYYGQHVDDRVQPQNPELVARAVAPDFALGPHTASLGLVASTGATLPAPFTNGMFVGQHGSWNRKPFSGYKVIFVPFAEGKPAGAPIDVLTGFLSDDGNAKGRPVGVAIDKSGALLVADDVGNVVWRVTASGR